VRVFFRKKVVNSALRLLLPEGAVDCVRVVVRLCYCDDNKSMAEVMYWVICCRLEGPMGLLLRAQLGVVF